MTHFGCQEKMRVLVAMLAAVSLASCATSPRDRSDQPRTADARDRVRAEELCDQAEPLMDTDPEEAERLLLVAIDADLYSGRSHNNLGVVYLRRGDLYQAASEFEWARRLMPDHPDPRINLGLTLERAGRIGDALDAYAAAHDLQPQHLGAMQALARAQVRHGRPNAETIHMLDEIALRGDERWREWANAQRARAPAR